MEATGINDDYTCDYASLGGPGTYTIRIEDNTGLGTGFPAIQNIGGASGEAEKIVSLDQWGTGIWQSMRFAFRGAANMEVTATDVPNLSQVTDASRMFLEATIADPDTSNWDTSSIQNMRFMFSETANANPDVSNWDTSQVTDMFAMFENSQSANPDVSNWDTSQVTDMGAMFLAADSANPDVSNWNTSNVENMYYMFSGRTTIYDPDVSNWDTSKVSDFSRMFENSPLADPDVSNWNTSSATTMERMFLNTEIANPNVSNWDTSNVQSFFGMFAGAKAANPDVSNWNTLSATTLAQMFNQAPLANPDTSNWDTTNVESISAFMVLNNNSFNLDVSNWNTENLRDASFAFYGINANPDVSNWNTSQLENVNSMFFASPNFDRDLSNWDVRQITDASFFVDNISSTQYDALLTSWSAQTLQPNVTLDVGVSTYCNAESERQNIITLYNWTIIDEGLNCADSEDDTDQPLELETLQFNGNDAIDIVFVGDGFTASQQTLYRDKMLEAYNGMFDGHPPFDARQDDFNVYSVATVSNESGISIQGSVTYDTALGSFTNNFDIDRVTGISEAGRKKLRDFFKEHLDKDVYLILILNTPMFAGSAEFNFERRIIHYASASIPLDGSLVQLVRHEFGHSFGKLADEYGGTCAEGDLPADYSIDRYNRPNVTYDAVNDRKWDDLVADPQYFLGANYCDNEWYRSSETGLMRSISEGTEHNELSKIILDELIDENLQYNQKVYTVRSKGVLRQPDEIDRNIRIYSDQVVVNSRIQCDDFYVSEDSEVRVATGGSIDCNTKTILGTLVVDQNRSRSERAVRFGCKDPKAVNYTRFARHRQDMCVYNKTLSHSVEQDGSFDSKIHVNIHNHIHYPFYHHHRLH
jgi:surface protein